MKFQFFLFLMFFLAGNLAKLNSQVKSDERIDIITDRLLYLSGENCLVHFWYFNDSDIKPNSDSKYLYIELLSQELNVIDQQITPINAGKGDCFFNIPKGTPTSTLIFRAYTREMRNFGPSSYTYSEIHVFNPEIQQKNISVSDSGITRKKIKSEIPVAIDIKGLPEIVKPRMNLDLAISISNLQGNPILGSFIFYIIKKGTENDTLIAANKPFSMDLTHDFAKESSGLILEGAVSPISNDSKTISIAVQGENTQVFNGPIKSDGKYKLIISPNFDPGCKMIYCVNNSKNTNFQIIPEPIFDIQKSELKIAGYLPQEKDRHFLEELMTTVQIQQISGMNPKFIYVQNSYYDLDFYGKPDKIILLSDFIKLPNMEEVFREIVNEVLVLHESSILNLQVVNKINNRTMGNTPGIFINGIPIINQQHIFDLPVSEVEKIHIVTSRYLVGNILYDGIVDIKTLQEVDTEKYDAKNFMTPPVKNNFTMATPQHKNRSALPDFRNTIIWISEPTYGDNGNMLVNFSTPDNLSEYLICIDGYSWNGDKITFKKPLLIELP